MPETAAGNDDLTAGGLARAAGLLQAGQSAEAEEVARQIVEAAPASARAWFLLGVARHMQKRPEAALYAMERAIAEDNDLDDARQACATLLLGLKRPRAALAHLVERARRMPGDVKALTDVGIVEEELGDAHAALTRYDEALRHAPGEFRARLNRGALFARLGRLEEALRDNQTLVRSHIGSAAAHYNLADVLLRLDRYEDALAAADRALRLAPRDVSIHMLRGLVLAMLERDDEAGLAFAEASEIDAEAARRYQVNAAASIGAPDTKRLTEDPRQIRLDRLLERQKACDWAGRDRLVRGLRALANELSDPSPQAVDLIQYHTSLSLPLTSREQQALAHGIASAVRLRTGEVVAPRQTSGSRNRKIRLGFLSPNFREHPSAQLHWRHMALRDRSRFDVFAYSLHRGEGALRQRIVESCDVFREVSAMDSREIAARIALDGVDILVDLCGHKDFFRPEVLALRPAPLRVSYLGLPATMDAELIDYRITDAFTTPPEEAAGWSEKLVYFPDTFWIYNDRETVAEPRPGRSECGLPEQGFVFCSFNNGYKMDPHAFGIWMRLLQRVPGSVLWLVDSGEAVKSNLRREAGARGVADGRIVFAPKVPRAEHLARHACADLFLDTFHYNAHTTAADALYAGLPVLTLPGRTMASRIGGSIVRAAGLPELVALDGAAYESTAFRLATQRGELAGLREKLVRGRSACALFDTVRRTKELDRAFDMMWRRHVAGLPPESFAVPPL